MRRFVACGEEKAAISGIGSCAGVLVWYAAALGAAERLRYGVTVVKLKKLCIRNFRCFENVELDVGSMHALVGANNAGKSTILKALDFLFNPSSRQINEESFCGRRTEVPIEVEGLFTELTAAEAEKLASYTRPDGSFHLKRSATLASEGSESETDGEEGDGKAIITPYYSKPQPKIEWLNPATINGANTAKWWAEKNDLVVNGASFVEFVGGTKPGVGAWKDYAAAFAAAHLKPEDFQDTWTANPQGYAGVLKSSLPKYVLIPAVRHAEDESKVTKSNPFGRLIFELMRGMDGAIRDRISASMRETTRLLNREGMEDRVASIAAMEATIKGYLSELMPSDLELQFQAPTLEVLLTTPRIVVNDGFRGSVEGKGHGLQRAVIFSILRAYARLMTERVESDRHTLILAVEEPELYMHPTAQRTIRRVLRSIADGGDQVLYCTHSPLLVDVAYFDEIIRCENSEPVHGDGKEGGRSRRFQLPMHAMIADIEERRPVLKGKITAHSMRERYSHAYTPSRNEGFFARKVILVEGATEAYALPVYAAALDIDLDSLGMSVVECGNKDGIDRMYRIFNELGIACYVLFDFDRDNKDPDRLKESASLLQLLGQPTPAEPVATTVKSEVAYFASDWEEELEKEILDYAALKAKAKKTLGLRNDSKPLIARYVARELANRTPPFVPPTVKRIIDAAVNVEWRSSCLKGRSDQSIGVSV